MSSSYVQAAHAVCRPGWSDGAGVLAAACLAGEVGWVDGVFVVGGPLGLLTCQRRGYIDPAWPAQQCTDDGAASSRASNNWATPATATRTLMAVALLWGPRPLYRAARAVIALAVYAGTDAVSPTVAAQLTPRSTLLPMWAGGKLTWWTRTCRLRTAEVERSRRGDDSQPVTQAGGRTSIGRIWLRADDVMSRAGCLRPPGRVGRQR
jgi:hypothetical protein